MRDDSPLSGRCSCGLISFRLTDTPLVVHCCHCTWCQRETGSAFVLNAMIETRRIVTTGASPAETLLPSASGKGQVVLRCPDCHVALWSHYSGAGRRFAFVRAGTLDGARNIVPDVHIFTGSALPWVAFPPGAKVFPEFYRRSDTWSPEALHRRDVELAMEG